MFEDLLMKVLHDATLMVVGIMVLLVLVALWEIWIDWNSINRGK